MEIIVDNLSKRYSSDWIFKDLDFSFHSNTTYAITGSNGSGKSTLLQIICGKLPPTGGKVNLNNSENKIKPEDHFKHISMCAPYMELIEEFSLKEMVNFHFHLNDIVEDHTPSHFISLLQLDAHKNKKISEFSSGMKQKLKLGLAILSKTDCLVLDEPTSNLDENAKEWFKTTVLNNLKDRIVIVASNESDDFFPDSKVLNIEDYK